MALRGFSGFEAMFRRSMAKKVNAASHICEKCKQNTKKTSKLYNITKEVNAASDIWKKLKMSNLNTHRLLTFRDRYFRKVVMFL